MQLNTLQAELEEPSGGREGPEAAGRVRGRGQSGRQGVQEGEVGRVEAKLVGMGEVRGIVSGNYGEMLEDTHILVAAMANSRVRVAGPTWGGGGG